MTIAGFDPSAGAGILADVKTVSAFGCYGVAAITSLTYQNTQGVFGSANQGGAIVRQQLHPLFDDFEIAAIKTGMLPSAEVIAAVAEELAARPALPLVVDPVIRSTSGYDLIDDEALGVLIEKLLPLATVVTPNAVEAERMTGIKIQDVATMQAAGEALLGRRAAAVLIKGGDLTGEEATDLLVEANQVAEFRLPRLASLHTHGSGCTLAAALACLLAHGLPLSEAVRRAKTYVHEAIRRAPGLGKGHGPLGHFPHLRAFEEL